MALFDIWLIPLTREPADTANKLQADSLIVAEVSLGDLATPAISRKLQPAGEAAGRRLNFWNGWSLCENSGSSNFGGTVYYQDG